MLLTKEKTVCNKKHKIFKTAHSSETLHYSDIKREWKDIFEEFDQEFIKRKPEFPPRSVFGTTAAYETVAERLNLPHHEKSFIYYDSTETIIKGPEITNDLNLTCNYNNMKAPDETSEISSRSSIIESEGIYNIPEQLEEILETGSHQESMPYTLDDLSVQVDEKDLKERQLEEIRENEKKTRKWKKYDGKQKAILKFLKLPERKAACWRPQTESTAEEFNSMSLPQRAAFVENTVASEFCEWLDSLGGIKSDLNEKTLKELFEIGLVNPASHSMASRCNEKSCIPDSVAKIRDVPMKSFRHGLLDHLAWDVYAKHLKPKKLAFNKLLPPEDRVKPSDNNSEEEWLTCKTIPQELISFHTVFADILHLRSLEGFCHYISKNPSCIKPDILVKKGFFHKATHSSKSIFH